MEYGNVLVRLLFREVQTLKFVKCSTQGKRYFSSARTHYEVLGVSPTCSNPDIKKAYLNLSKKLHPDMKPDDATQHKKFIELNNAYSTLINVETRKAYDRDLKSGASRNSDSTWRHQETSHGPFYKDTWWDERTWNQRQKAKGSFYSGSSRHDVKRTPDIWIVSGCFTLMLIGAVLYFTAYSFATNYTHRRIDTKSGKISKAYFAAKEKAQENGKQRQLEKLHQRWGISKNTPDDE